jgi:branched-chain amino acid transport system permease protein
MMDWRRQATELFASAGAWVERCAKGTAAGLALAKARAGSLAARQVIMTRLAWKRSRRVVAAAAAALGMRLRAAPVTVAMSDAQRIKERLAAAVQRALRMCAPTRRALLPAFHLVQQTCSALGERLKAFARVALIQAEWRLRRTPLKPALMRFRHWRHSRTHLPHARYRVEVATMRSRRAALVAALLLLFLLILPGFAGRDLVNDLILLFTMLALAQYWNLLAGYAGLVSIGQQAFVGLGGYLLFAFTIHAGLDPLLAILLAGLVAGLLAFPTAFIVFRLRGAYFAIGTWVVAEVYRLIFAQFRQLGGGTGTSLPPFVTNEVAGIEWVKALFHVRTSAARDIITYWAALLLAASTILAVYLVLRFRYGLALAAIRDSEPAAESVGVDSFRTKLMVYVTTAVGTGMVGALIYLQKARISPDAAFSVVDWTAYVIFIVVIGGIGTIEGPIIGVLVFYLLQTNLAHFGSWYLILLGLLAIVVMLFAPKGIWGSFSERYQTAAFPLRRRLYENSAERREPTAAGSAH